MDRRNFLAFIPSLGAIPFIGKDITKNESGIHILQPKHIIQPGISDGFDPLKLEIRLYQEGHHIANAYMTEIELRNEIVSDLTTGKYIYGGGQRITFQGVVDGPMVFNRESLKK